MIRFGAPRDRGVLAFNVVGYALVFGLAVGIPGTWAWMTGFERNAVLATLILAGACLAWLLAGLSLTPHGYAVGEGKLVVERRWLPVQIPLARVERVDRLPPGAVSRSLVVFGSAGSFGYWGVFYGFRLGFYRRYGRGSGDRVLVEAQGRRYVLEPERPDDLVRAVNEAKAGRAGPPATAP